MYHVNIFNLVNCPDMLIQNPDKKNCVDVISFETIHLENDQFDVLDFR